MHVFTVPRPLRAHNYQQCGMERLEASLLTTFVRGRNINRLSIGYAFRPHLRTRLTPR